MKLLRAHNPRQRVGRRLRALLLASAALVPVTLAGCGGLSGKASDPQTLVVVNWKGYGSDQEWAVKEFEEKTGADVVHRYISSETEILQLLRDVGVDVALPNFQFIGPAIREGLIQPLDAENLDTLNQIYPQLVQQPGVTTNGKLYGVPWVWGYSSVFYNTDVIKEAPRSVGDLWDPKHRGKVALTDDATLNVLLAALYLREDPADPDLAKVEDALIRLKENAGLITASPDELAKAITSRTVVIGIAAPSQVGSYIAEGLPVDITVPTEGAIGWGDTWAIAASSGKTDLAYQYINYMTSKGFLTRWAEDPAAASPSPANSEAVAALSSDARKRIKTDPATLSELTLQGPLPDSTLDAWVDVWEKVKAS
jgi:spermidine/putrescine-binding protein